MGILSRFKNDKKSNYSIEFLTDMYGHPTSVANDYLVEINNRLAQDLANINILSEDENWNYIFNTRVNSLTPAYNFHVEFFYNYLKNGIAIAIIRNMKILSITQGNIISIDEKYIRMNIDGEKITLSLSEVIILYNDIFVAESVTNKLLFTTLTSLIAKIPLSNKIGAVFQLESQMDKKRMKELADKLAKPGNNGVVIVDNSVKSVQFNDTNSNTDYTQIDYVLNNILASLNFPKEVYFNTATQEQFKMYIFNKIEPILKLYEQELEYKFKKDIQIIHEVRTLTTPDQTHKAAMIGAIKINEYRRTIGLPPIKEGDVLIENWNKTNSQSNEE